MATTTSKKQQATSNKPATLELAYVGGCTIATTINLGSSPAHTYAYPVDEEMKGNKKRRVVMRRQQSFAVRAKRIILPIIIALGIFVLLTRTIGSAPQDDKRRQFVHLRGGNNKDLVWVHSDSQPFVSGTCLVIISLEGLCNYCGYSYTFV